MRDALDERFAPPGPRDEPVVISECAYCGDSINVGDDAIITNAGDFLHDLCEVDYLRRFHVDKRGVISADGTVD